MSIHLESNTTNISLQARQRPGALLTYHTTNRAHFGAKSTFAMAQVAVPEEPLVLAGKGGSELHYVLSRQDTLGTGHQLLYLRTPYFLPSYTTGALGHFSRMTLETLTLAIMPCGTSDLNSICAKAGLLEIKRSARDHARDTLSKVQTI